MDIRIFGALSQPIVARVLWQCFFTLAACMISTASGAITNSVYSSVCASCHGANAADNVNNIKLGANNPSLIQSLISSNVGGMGILKNQISSADISSVATFLGQVFSPNQGAPAIIISPSSIAFPSRAVGASGGGVLVSMSNPGTGTLVISGISASRSDFTVISGCGGSLAPATSCFLTVSFSPKSAGTITGTLGIQSNATPATSQIGLSGVGTDAGTPVPVSNYQGLWGITSESGWGMSITQHASTIFAALYTYDQAGQPIWYVLPGCPLAASACSSEIYKVTGGTSPAVPWNGSAKLVTSVGTGTLTFSDTNTGTLNVIINGVAGVKSIAKSIFATGTAPPAIDYTDLWWNANESGWGVALTQQYGIIFAAWYTYDAAGKPVWYVASSCTVSGNGCSGDVYQVTGGTPLTSPWNGANKAVTRVGSVTFSFTDGSNGTMSYTLNGVAGNRAITRQPF